MKKEFVILIALVAVISVTTEIFAQNSETSQTAMLHQMSMSSDVSGDFGFFMAGSGTVLIDWGDGSESETHTLKDYDIFKWLSYDHKFEHSYSDASVRTITITGENITHLLCGGILSLDVSKNPVLKYLYCGMDILPGSKLRARYCKK